MTRSAHLAVGVAGLVVLSVAGVGLAATGAVSSTAAVDIEDRSTTAETETDAASAPAVSGVTDHNTSADSSFTAYAQEGTIVLGGNQDEPILIPESDEDEPQPENAPDQVEWEDDSFVIDADVDLEDGVWEADAEEVSFPLITSYRVSADRAEVQMRAVDGFEGTIDPETGEMTAEAAFEIEVVVVDPLRGIAPDSTCVTETDLELTTETGDAGGPFEVDTESETATATVVDDSFTVPGFDTVDGSGTVCGSAADTYGLPAEEPGDNEFELELWFDLDGFADDPAEET